MVVLAKEEVVITSLTAPLQKRNQLRFPSSLPLSRILHLQIKLHYYINISRQSLTGSTTLANRSECLILQTPKLDGKKSTRCPHIFPVTRKLYPVKLRPFKACYQLLRRMVIPLPHQYVRYLSHKDVAVDDSITYRI